MKSSEFNVSEWKNGSIWCENDWVSVADLEHRSRDQLSAGLQRWQEHVWPLLVSTSPTASWPFHTSAVRSRSLELETAGWSLVKSTFPVCRRCLLSFLSFNLSSSPRDGPARQRGSCTQFALSRSRSLRSLFWTRRRREATCSQSHSLIFQSPARSHFLSLPSIPR